MINLLFVTYFDFDIKLIFHGAEQSTTSALWTVRAALDINLCEWRALIGEATVFVYENTWDVSDLVLVY